ncbi:hypothetical protein, partial [Kitasatospora sp. NPDC007106]|uniref:hypothetical protein n=1 Tax=Kitasatospora sp. NPDC007106 TaxID=3156914 RepID=UPI0033F1049D
MCSFSDPPWTTTRKERRCPDPPTAPPPTAPPPALDTLLPHGLGQLTRPFSTAPVDPATGALS